MKTGRWKILLAGGGLVVALLILWNLLPRPSSPRVAVDTDQQPAPLSPEDAAGLETQRALIESALEPRYGSKLTRTAADLAPLQRLLDDGLYTKDQKRELEAMGAVLGDVLAGELPLHWVMLGGRPALILVGTRAYYHPLTMISSPMAQGDRVNVRRLFDDVRASIVARDPKLLDQPR
jgi:hypothetical protein